MIGLLIAAIIVFALVKRHRCRDGKPSDGRDKWSRKWDRWQARASKAERFGEARWAKWTHHWNEKENWAQDAHHRVHDGEHQSERKFGDADAGVNRSTGKTLGRDGDTPGRSDTAASSAQNRSLPLGNASRASEPQFKNEQERASYRRARKRAAQEAGFYLHLMWYGIIIGFLLILNLVVSPSIAWWIFPALGWGIGLASHFGAVYGWRWIHERVFEPAIQREVQREVSLEKEALRTEKQASLDELTANFAHEIRNPIAAAKSLVQQMGEDPTSNENVEYAKVALDELARVERSVAHLLKYAKEEDYSFANVNLASVLDSALTQMRGKLEAKQISVSRNYIGGPTVRADAEKLRQVFTNVIDNAIDAMESNSGERRLELWIRGTYPGTAAVVVRDNGCGIPDDKVAKIFNPFYTTKQNGTGLGMGIARKVMEAHHGRIEVTSKVGSGTEFSLSIPLSDAGRAWSETAFDPATPANSQTPPLADAQSRETPVFADTTIDDSAAAALHADTREPR